MKSLSFCNHCYSCILRHFDAAAIHSSAAALLLLLLLSAGVVFLAWAAPAVGAAGPFVPPATPTVAPVISGVYPNDLDGNRIDDDLDELDAAKSPSGLFEAGRSLAPLSGACVVDVELIFDGPVTQEQIDAFARLGGEITYMFRAVSYGWNGRIARDRVAAFRHGAVARSGDAEGSTGSPPHGSRHADRAGATGLAAWIRRQCRGIPRRSQYHHRDRRYGSGRRTHGSGGAMRLLERYQR